MPSVLKLLNEYIEFPIRRHCIIKKLHPFLEDSEKILDLGASCGRLSFQLSKKLPNSEFRGVDIHVQPKTQIPIDKYDGKTLPFPDNHFDSVIIVDVLHHDNNPERILKEAKRVSKKDVLIKDHFWDNKVDLFLLKFADYLGNKPYGVRLPYNFYSLDQWDNLFEKLNLKKVESKTFNYYFLHPIKHVIFKLEK